MDTISLYKHRIDALMNIIFGAGTPNPQTIIEQLNYLLFLRALSIKDDEAELLGITDESEKIFTGDLTNYRWQNLLTLNAEDLFKTLETSFDVLQKKSKNPTVKLLFRNAHIKIFDKPTLRRVLHEVEAFAKELDAVAHEGNKDVFGDMYEYLLSKLSSAGTNGQFRTPRHIIDFMVKVVDPKKNETILDPACGTAGFLVAAYRYIAGEYTSEKMKKAGSPRAMDKLSADEKSFLFNHMFSGFDSDEDMIKFGMMNLHLHGLTKSRLVRQNSLTDTTGMKDKFDVILANPPFSGKIDEESVSEDIRMGTKATELLFLRFMMDHLSSKGKMAVVVPEGVVANSSRAHVKAREMLLENGVWCVVSLPPGVFNPYASVKTDILFLDKALATKSKSVLFIKIAHDGFDLGSQRRPTEANDIPQALELLSKFKELIAKGNLEESARLAAFNSSIALLVGREEIDSAPDKSLASEKFKEEDNTNKTLPQVPLRESVIFIRGLTYKKTDESNKETSNVVLRANNIDLSTGKLNFNDLKYLRSDFEGSVEKKVQKGDILICTASGSKDHLGKVAIVDKDSGYYFGGFMAVLRANRKVLLPEYLHFLLTSRKYRDYIHGLSAGVNINNLNGNTLLELKIPLPSIKDQTKFLKELGKYQKAVDSARNSIVENGKLIQEKMASIWEE